MTIAQVLFTRQGFILYTVKMTYIADSTPSIGKRIADYRKFGKIGTAADLAARIPNPKVTASVIQNIESGRKADLSVSQLLDIAMGLGVFAAGATSACRFALPGGRFAWGRR